MLEADGTPTKKNLGANAILGVSLAAAKAAAQQALVTTTPATSQLHDCAYYYDLVVAARADAESGLWDACAIALGQVDSD